MKDTPLLSSTISTEAMDTPCHFSLGIYHWAFIIGYLSSVFGFAGCRDAFTNDGN